MIEFAKLPLDERVPYFQEVASRRGLTRLIVEKDFWVCFTLRLLFATPELADKFVFKEPECRVVSLEAERTFWEKATILHAEYHRPQDKPMRNRLSRDCYDMCHMAEHKSGQRALTDSALLESVDELLRQLNEIEDKINGKPKV